MRVSSIKPRLTTEAGFSLIEVLISMFILAVGLLGAGALQTVGLQTTMGAYNRSQATFLASDIVDRMRGNRDALASYNNVDTNSPITTATACLTTTSGCAPAELANANISEWQGYFNDINMLPGGRGRIVSTGVDDFVITISWNEREWSSTSYVRNEADTKTYQLAVSLKDN